MKINKIVLGGGGIKGIAYVGILKYLEEENLLKDIDTLVGTSVGAFIALLISLGYTSNQIFEIIKEIDFSEKQNITTDSIMSIFTNYGFDDGIFFQNIINILIEKKTKKKEITFKELYDMTGKNLIISTACVDKKNLVYFNHIDYPDMEVNLTIRMAISIPILFSPIKHNDLYYVDGGLLNNYPISLFDSNDKNILGFTFTKNKSEKIDSFFSYLKTLIFTPLDDKESEIINLYNEQSIIIDCGNCTVFDFEIDLDKKRDLYNIGYNSIKKYFENREEKYNHNWIYLIEKINNFNLIDLIRYMKSSFLN